MISEVNRAVEQRGLKRIGILGTRTVIERRFYGRVASAEIIPPSAHDLGDVHRACVDMTASGVVAGPQRTVFSGASQSFIHAFGAEAIIPGGTDLALALNEKDAPLPIVDCAGVHVGAIARLALS
jgi:aspartate racemase